jgi:hypothetical protein
MTEPGRDRVECYSGHTYPQEPRVVFWQGRRYLVSGIERRWRTPEGPAFRVETEQGMPFELCYSETERAWAIQPLAEDDQDTLELSSRDKGKQESENHNPYRNHHEDKEVREER